MNQKTRKILSFTLKALVSVGAIGFVIYKLCQPRLYEGAETNTWELIWQLPSQTLWMLIFPGLLVIANLGLEALKWKILIKPFYPEIGINKAFQAVLSGMTTGIFTPNRVGEYAGRVLFLGSGFRFEATVLTFFDRLSQMFVTLLAGLIALIWISTQFQAPLLNEIFGSEVRMWWIAGGGFLLLVFILILSYRPAMVLSFLGTIGIRSTLVKKSFETLRGLDKRKLFQVTLLSLARYTVFSFQYYLLMRAFGYAQEIWLAGGMIALVFLLKSLIPFIGLSELGVRESAAMIIMGWFGVDVVVAFSSTLILYVINIILPTLAGIPFVYRIKIPLSTEK